MSQVERQLRAICAMYGVSVDNWQARVIINQLRRHLTTLQELRE